jgi:hypothetical protein
VLPFLDCLEQASRTFEQLAGFSKGSAEEAGDNHRKICRGTLHSRQLEMQDDASGHCAREARWLGPGACVWSTPFDASLSGNIRCLIDMNSKGCAQAHRRSR